MKPFNIPWRELKTKNHYLVHVNPRLIEALNTLDWFSGFRVVCHMLYDESRPLTNMHRRGLAADIHINGFNVLDQYLWVQRFNLFGGVGIYGPDVWRNPGVHVDLRDAGLDARGARWAFRAKERRFDPAKAEREMVAVDREYIKYLLGIM